jgi:hypothetical protein
LVFAAPLLVQVRRGAMTLAALNAIERRVREPRVRIVAPGARVALVAVLEEGAPVVRDEVREEQRRVIHGMFDGIDGQIAVIVVGDGLVSTLQRTVARGMAFTTRRTRVVKTPEEAAAWVAPHLGVAAAEVRSVVERARGLR